MDRLHSRGWFGVLVVLILISCSESPVTSSQTCNTSEECQNSFNLRYECTKGKCLREHYDYRPKEMFGLLMVIMISCITNAGGVGAGTVVVPVYVAFLEFASSDAVHLSRITIFAGAFVNFLINWRKRDPKNKDRLVINYNIAAVMIPLHVAGAEMGVILGRFFPPIFVTGILLVFLAMSLTKTFQRAKEESRKEETRALKHSKYSITSKADISSAVGGKSEIDFHQSNEGVTLKSSQDLGERELNQFDNRTEENADGSTFRQDNTNIENTESPDALKEDKSQIEAKGNNSSDENFYSETFATVSIENLIKEQYLNFVYMGISFLTVVLSALIRGGDGRPSIIGIETCSRMTWKIVYVSQLISIVVSYYSYSHNKRHLEKQSRQTMTMTQDRKIRNKLFIASYFTGIASGVVGVGGGMVLSIYMLSLGMDVSSTGYLSIFAILFSSSSTTIQSVIAGGIHLRHAYLVMTMSFIGAILGTCCLKEIISQLNRPSLILWVLVSVLTIANLVVPYQMFQSVLANPITALSFGKLC